MVIRGKGQLKSLVSSLLLRAGWEIRRARPGTARAHPPQFPHMDLRGQGLAPADCLHESHRIPALVEVPLADCRWWGPTGFGFGAGSRHPYIASLRQFLEAPSTDIESTALWKYYATFQPTTLAEFQGLRGPDIHPALRRMPPLNVFPWSGRSVLQMTEAFTIEAPPEPGSVHRPKSCGPQTLDVTRIRVEKLVALADIFATEGPWRTPPQHLRYLDQAPVGDILLRDRDQKLLLAGGQHRSAALSCLGHDSVDVLVGTSHYRGPAVVRRGDVDRWPMVRQGLYTRQQALSLFDRIFDGTGIDY